MKRGSVMKKLVVCILLMLMCGCAAKTSQESFPLEYDTAVFALPDASSTLPPEQPESLSPADSTDLNSAAAENIEGPEVQSADIPPCEKVSYREDPVGCIRYFLWQKACEYQQAGFEDAFNGKNPPWNFTLGIADLNDDGVPELLFHDTGPGGKVYELWLYDISGEEPVPVGSFNVGGSVTGVCQIKTDDGLPHYRVSSCWGNSTLTNYTTAFIRALPDGGFDIWECESLYNETDGPQDTQGGAVRHNGEPVEDPDRTLSTALFTKPVTPCSTWFYRVAGFTNDRDLHAGVRVDSECAAPWWQSYAEAAVELFCG